MIRPDAIISDADGTLVDTLHLIRHGLHETIVSYLTTIQGEIQPSFIPSYEEFETVLHSTIGGSAHHTLERTTAQLYRSQPELLAVIDYDALHALLNPIQDKIAPEYVVPYKGLPSLLTTIGHLDIKFAIFTSGSRYHIVRNFGVALPQLGLTELYRDTSIDDAAKLQQFEQAVMTHFDIKTFTIVTCDDVPTHKPDPASLQLAMSRLNAHAEQTIVLGDHAVDMQAALHAGVPNRLGVTHGFNDDEILIGAGATQAIHSLDELTSQLEMTLS